MNYLESKEFSFILLYKFSHFHDHLLLIYAFLELVDYIK